MTGRYRHLDKLVNAIMSMGATGPQTNRSKLIEDADVMFDKYMNVTNLDELDLSALLTEVTDLASKHHISIPGKYTMLVRSIATIEGVIEQWLWFALLMLSQPLFYGVALTHVAVSVTRGLITLGLLSSIDTQKRIDRVVYILCALAFAVSTFVVLRTELAMFLSGGGPA